MTDLRQAAKQALEILDMCFYDEEDAVYCLGGWHQEKFMDAREALRQALAQPEQKPAGEIQMEDLGGPLGVMAPGITFYKGIPKVGTKIYTAPPRREWVGLTDDELEDLEFASVDKKYGHLDVRVLSRAIEQQLKERNGG